MVMMLCLIGGCHLAVRPKVGLTVVGTRVRDGRVVVSLRVRHEELGLVEK
jgi:hypothetical protein